MHAVIGRWTTDPSRAAELDRRLQDVILPLGCAWRGQRGGVAAVIVSRLLAAVLGIPAFFTDGVPRWVLVVVTVGIVLTLVATALLVSSRRAGGLSAAGAWPARAPSRQAASS